MGEAAGVAEEDEFDAAKIALLVDPSVELGWFAVVLSSNEAGCVGLQLNRFPSACESLLLRKLSGSYPNDFARQLVDHLLNVLSGAWKMTGVCTVNHH